MENLFELIPAHLAEVIGWTVFHSIWQAAIIWIVITALQTHTRFKSPSAKFNLSMIGQLAVLFSVILTASFLLYVSNGAQVLAGQSLETFSGTSIGRAISQSEISYRLNEQMGTISLIWLLGFILISIRFISGLYQVKKLNKSAEFINNKRINDFIDKIKKQLNIASEFSIKWSAKLTSPAVIGFFKPCIILPISIINQLSDEEVEFILLHEMAHIKRFDHLSLILQRVVEVLLYFNPFIWLMSKQLNVYREEACDDLVLAHSGNNSIQYTKTLVRLHELIHPAQSTNGFKLAAVGKKGHLWQRIHRLLINDHKNEFNMNRLFFIALVPLALLLASFYVKSQDAETVETPIEVVDLLSNSRKINVVTAFDNDTIPVENGQSKVIEKISSNNNGERLEAEYVNGELKKLKVNRKTIAEEDFGKYQKELAKINEKRDEKEDKSSSKSMFFKSDDAHGNRSDIKIEGDEIIINGKSIDIDDIMDSEDGFRLKMEDGKIEINGNSFEIDFEEIFNNIDINFDEVGPEIESALEEAMHEIEKEFDENDFNFNIQIDGEEDGEEFNLNFSNENLGEMLGKLAEGFENNQGEFQEFFKNLEINLEDGLGNIGNLLNDLELDINIETDGEDGASFLFIDEDGNKKTIDLKGSMMEQGERSEELKEAMKLMRENMARDREGSFEKRANMDEEREGLLSQFFAAKKPSTLEDKLGSELKNDGLITNADDFKLKLKDNKLKVNGKKLSSAMARKYSKLIEKHTRTEINPESTIVIEHKKK